MIPKAMNRPPNLGQPQNLYKSPRQPGTILLMAAREPQEPRPPEPEAFNLTKERIDEFENAYTWFSVRVRRVVFVLAFLYIVSKLADDGSIVMSLLASLLLSCAIAFMIASPGGATLGALWKWMQSDCVRVRMYESAIVQFKVEHTAYKVEHAAWLKTQRSWWDNLNPKRFEQEVAEFFRAQGHRVEWTGRSGDGGVDIRLIKQDGKRVVVQCKAHGKPISPAAVRDLYGTLLHAKADEAWLMSRSGFTLGAMKFAADKPIRLLNLDHVLPGLGR